MLPICNNSTSTSNLPGPQNILREQLSNGIVVLLKANQASASFVFSGSLPAGGMLDPEDKLGLADFTARMLMRGTESNSYIEIYEQLESIAASLGFSGGVNQVGFSGRALVEDLDLLLDQLAQSLRHPIFPADQAEQLRTQLLTSLSIRSQDTAEMTSLTFDQMVYSGHPYSHPVDGYPETIQRIQPSDLNYFHGQHYGPQGMRIALSGGFEPEVVLEQIRIKFEDWKNPQQGPQLSIPKAPIMGERRNQQVKIAGKHQTDIITGAAGPRRTEPEYMAASLGNNILGRFGMMGRLGDSLREQAGLAYYVSSSLGGGLGPGPWQISAGVDPKNLEQAIELIFNEIRRFTSQPVSESELSDSQANYIGRLPISFETNGGVASAMLALERYQLGFDYYQRYPEIVRSVTPEQILQVAFRYLNPDLLAVVSAGPDPEAIRSEE